MVGLNNPLVLLLLPSLVHSFVNKPFSFMRSKLSSSSMAPTAIAASQTNIFEDYSKPIVLVGASSDKGEMQKLGESLSNLFGSKVLSPEDGMGGNFADVVVLDFQEDDFTDNAKSMYESGLLSIYVNVESEMTDKEEGVFLPYSDYEICVRQEGTDPESDDWKHIEWELSRLVARALLPPPIPGDKERTINSAHLTMGSNTFFLSLSFPKIEEVEPYVSSMCEDVDAMEYRTDLLECRDSRFDLIYGQQLLRKYCRPHARRVPGLPLGNIVLDDVMPTVYTVRTENQAGTYPDDEASIGKMFELLEWGLRSGVEVLDVESSWNADKTQALLDLAETRYSSQILGSYHVVGKETSLEEAVELFLQCGFKGRAHGAKVVLSIDAEEKDRTAYEASLIASSLAKSDGKPDIPNISLILGKVGQFSRIINIPFTPVTHESLPFKAAPGQLTSAQIMTTRILTKIYQSKNYAILGHNIAYSVSPQMHGSAFRAVLLPNEYARADVATVEEFVESDFWKSDNFGGTSVTIPHKQSIIPYIDVMSDAAKTIGSCNTVVAREEFNEETEEMERVIYGYNTDWKGIFNPLRRILPSTGGYALILGAGGTARAAAYAAEKLGLERLYFNRTPAKAQQLAETFGGSLISSLEQDGDLAETLQDGKPLCVVISTLPAAAEFELPDWVLPLKPTVFDVNYKPYYTNLLRQAESAGLNVVRGSEMLWEQGVGQFELWTGRTAPYKVMKDVVLENCLPKEEETEVVQETANLDES